MTDIFKQFKAFPSTRYMGSKEKLIPHLFEVFKSLSFETSVDLMSGTGVVSYLLKTMNKKVFSNDFMTMNYQISKALIENSSIKLNKNDIEKLMANNDESEFVYKKFKKIYFDDDDTLFINSTLNNINLIKNEYKKSIAISCLVRSCIKKRPRGIFAYTGLRYNDNRPDLNKTLKEHFVENVSIFNSAIFDNGKINKSSCDDCLNINKKADLVYIDPPYFSKLSDNDYTRRYHFVEGISRNWQGLEIQENTKTKKFKSYKSPFSTLNGTIDAFNEIFKIYKSSIIVLSYSSNSLPDKETIYSILKCFKKDVEILEIDYRYSFANQGNVSQIKNKVKEYIFIAK